MTDHADVHEQLRLLTALGAAAAEQGSDKNATAELQTGGAIWRIPRARIMARFECMLYGDDSA